MSFLKKLWLLKHFYYFFTCRVVGQEAGELLAAEASSHGFLVNSSEYSSQTGNTAQWVKEGSVKSDNLS